VKTAKWFGENGTAAQKLAFDLANTKKEVGELTPEMEKLIRAKYVDKSAASGIKKEASAYASLMTSIQAKTEENRQELAVGHAVSESQKLSIKLDQQLATGKSKLSDAHQSAARSALAELAATELSLKTADAQRDVTSYIKDSTVAREASVAALAVESAAYGQSADARAIAMVAIEAQTWKEKELDKLREEHKPISDSLISQLDAEVAARTLVGQATMGQSKALQYAAQLADENKKDTAQAISDPRARATALLQIDVDIWQERIRLAGAGTAAQKILQAEYDTWYANRLKAVSVSVDLTQATQLLDIMAALDDAAKSAAEGMANSFGQVGTAIGGLTTTLTGYGRTQAAIAAQLAAATKDSGGDTGKIARANAVAAQQSAQAQMKSYGDMAGAAKGFFKTNSAGYRAMEGVEKTYRAFEMAMAIKNMIAKSGLLEAFTGLFVAGKATETAATVASVAPDIAASMAKGTAAAAAGVAGQAAGDPYTAWARMAAMAAAMAALGFAVSGGNSGGGGATAAEVQKSQGTGSVFGDSSAKSNSIARGIELSASNSNIQLDYTSGMLAALKSIDASMSGLTNLVVGAGGVTDGRNLGIQTGTIAGASSAASAVGTIVGGVLLGIGGAWLGNKLASLWGKTTQNIVDSGLQLGGSVSDLQSGKGFQQYASVDTTKSSWFGLSKNTSNSVKTAGLDDSLSSQFGLIFQDLEVALDTAAGGLGVREEEVTKALQNLVIAPTKVSLKDLKGDELTAAINGVISKTMDGMAAAAFPGLDRFRKVGEGYAETVMRLATDSAKLDGILGGIGGSFGATGIASLDARESLISMAGGIDELASKTKDFAGNYLSQAEQLAPVQQYLTERMTAMGLAAVQTRDDFKKVVLGLVESGALATAAGAQQYTDLMELQEAFAKTHAATVDLTMSEQAIADQRKDLQTKYNELTKTTAQLHADERAGIPAVNLALYDQVYAMGQLKDAAKTAAAALETTVDGLKATKASSIAYRDSLATGTLSTLTPMQKYLETQRQYTEGIAKAMANPADSAAQSAAQTAATNFLTASQVINASSAAYVADRSKVIGDMTSLSDIAGTQLTEAQKQLAAANDQVNGINTLNTTALGIQQAIVDLGSGGSFVSPVAQSTLVTSSADSDASITQEIKRLYTRIDDLVKVTEGRRKDAQEQADDLAEVVEETAATVADGLSTAVKDANWRANNPASRTSG
ncbi:MAG: hypothetical protein M3Y65_11740, partial [Pseudomonadota bacterium]|nr:hypothetical protein [Pseudomonadota bacterium]